MSAEFSSTTIVRISDCDASARWRLSSIFVQAQEIAEVHAATYNLSRKHLISNGVCWIIYRQRARMHRYPSYDEAIAFTTWPSATEGPIFPRHFLLTDAAGAPVGEITMAWVLMDIRTRRPMRPGALPGKVPLFAAHEAPMPTPAMLRIVDAEPIGERVVRYSDVDVNGHMNNTRYIDWVCDTLDLDTLRARGLADFQINYISEGRPGETLALAQRTEGDRVLVTGKHAEDGRAVFDASATFA